MLRFDEKLICIGIDEVGRGALAGPVMACAILIDYDNIPDGINDSKKLSKDKRERIFKEILSGNHIFAIGEASNFEIDEMNILNATMLAMKRAFDDLLVKLNDKNRKFDLILIDGNKSPFNFENAKTIIQGDSKYIEIAIASIIAKVIRDEHMRKISEIFPKYGFEKNAGYGTKEHFEAIKKFGILEIHRKSFLRKTDKEGFEPSI